MQKHAIIYGQLQTPLQRKAVDVLSRILMAYTQAYPICLAYDAQADYTPYRCFYIGTRSNHGYFAAHSATLSQEEAYQITVSNDTVSIEGFDDAGVLYGCMDFCSRYILHYSHPQGKLWTVANDYWRNLFAKPLPDYSYTSAPAVNRRGIWTWGHVIYDYRGFLDNMLKLKMNTLILWNDHVPFNAQDIIDYAHSCGIRVIWGYAWGWDDGCNKLSLKVLDNMTQDILDKFQKEYAPLDVDGIYFQSITEVNDEYLDGIPIADAVTAFVNRTASLLLEAHPGLELQFGLHATSVKNRLEVIRRVDSRIRIVWEDCGDFPFHYFPHEVADFAQTKAFAESIAVLRGENDKFGVVTKSFTKLYWPEFVHLDGPVCIGACPENIKEAKQRQKSKDWKYLQAFWLENGDKALEIIQSMTQAKQGDLYITALVEDGLFEQDMMYAVALYAEMLWDQNTPFPELLRRVALRTDITFA